MQFTKGKQAVHDLCLLVLGASFYTLAFPPYQWSEVAWFALTPLFVVLRGKPPRVAFTAGFLFGVFSCMGVTAWVHFTLVSYFSLEFPFNIICTLLSYAFFGGLPMGSIALAASLLTQSHGDPIRVLGPTCWLGVPALWVTGEYVRSSLIPGFSWGILGYSQFDHLLLIQIADLTGVYGLSFLIAFSSFVAAEALGALRVFRSTAPTSHADWRGFWPASSVLAIGLLATVLYGAWRLSLSAEEHASPLLNIGIVRGDIPSEQRWEPLLHGSTLTTYMTLTRRGLKEARPHLIVWPEFAVGFYPDREPRLHAQLSWFTHELKAPLLLGAPRLAISNETERYYNSAYLIAPGKGIVDIYDKIHLVPFAEYRPLALPSFTVHSMDHPSEFTAGDRFTVFSLQQGTFGALICYEATYPYLARRMVRDGAQFLVNISNDAWLKAGGEEALTQHFAMAAFRAVENRRFLVRAATDGVSGFIDPYGRSSHLSTAREGVIVGQIAPSQAVTVYTRYGDWFALGSVGFALLAFVWNTRYAGVKHWLTKEQGHAL